MRRAGWGSGSVERIARGRCAGRAAANGVGARKAKGRISSDAPIWG